MMLEISGLEITLNNEKINSVSKLTIINNYLLFNFFLENLLCALKIRSRAANALQILLFWRRRKINKLNMNAVA